MTLPSKFLYAYKFYSFEMETFSKIYIQLIFNLSPEMHDAIQLDHI